MFWKKLYLKVSFDIFFINKNLKEKVKRDYMKKDLFIIIVILFPFFLLAHPHVFIGVDSEFIFTETELLEIKFHWVFDDMTSFAVLEEFDKNGDDILNESETLRALSVFKELQSEHDYFIHLTINDSTFTDIQLSNFKAVMEDICLAYYFDVKINLPISKIKGKIKLSVYDAENYVKLFIHEDLGFRYKSPETIKIEAKKYINYDISFYYGQLNPEEYSIEIINE